MHENFQRCCWLFNIKNTNDSSNSLTTEENILRLTSLTIAMNLSNEYSFFLLFSQENEALVWRNLRRRDVESSFGSSSSKATRINVIQRRKK